MYTCICYMIYKFVMVHACCTCWYRTSQECTGSKESEDVYDNPDDLTQWAHVDVMMGVVMYVLHV